MLQSLRFNILGHDATSAAFAAVRRDVTRTQTALGGLRTAALSFRSALIGITGVAGISGFQRLIDSGIRIQNSLRVAGLEGEELTRVYDRLFESAQRNMTPMEGLAELYNRAALAQKELNVSSEELLGFTDKVAVALRVAGKSAAESRGALIQLSQAIGGGVVRAEEFNSILEGALPIAQAAAAGLKEAGGSVASLRRLVIDGKVSSEAFFRAFEAGSFILEDKVVNAQVTVAQSLIRLQNTLVDAASAFDRVVGASLGAASGLEAMSGAISSLVSDEEKLRRYVELAERLLFAFIGFKTGRLLGPGGAVLGGLLGSMAPEIRDRFSDGAPTVSNAQLPGSAGILPRGLTLPNVGPKAPVSLADFVGPAAQGIGGGTGSATGQPLDIRPLTSQVTELKDELSDTAQVAKGFFSDFIGGLRQGQSFTESLANSLGRVADKLLDAGLNMLFGSIFGGGGLFGIPGFASGGSMIAGGSGGPDSQLLMARVSPGERIDFTPRGRSRAGDEIRVIIDTQPSPLFVQQVRTESRNQAVQVVKGAGAAQQRREATHR